MYTVYSVECIMYTVYSVMLCKIYRGGLAVNLIHVRAKVNSHGSVNRNKSWAHYTLYNVFLARCFAHFPGDYP